MNIIRKDRYYFKMMIILDFVITSSNCGMRVMVLPDFLPHI